jgi:hypothetical protein
LSKFERQYLFEQILERFLRVAFETCCQRIHTKFTKFDRSNFLNLLCVKIFVRLNISFLVLMAACSNIQHQFDAVVKSQSANSSEITLEQINKWLTEAKLMGKKVTPNDTKSCFDKFKFDSLFKKGLSI